MFYQFPRKVSCFIIVLKQFPRKVSFFCRFPRKPIHTSTHTCTSIDSVNLFRRYVDIQYIYKLPGYHGDHGTRSCFSTHFCTMVDGSSLFWLSIFKAIMEWFMNIFVTPLWIVHFPLLATCQAIMEIWGSTYIFIGTTWLVDGSSPLVGLAVCKAIMEWFMLQLGW